MIDTALLELAAGQHGYFTAGQAAAAGIRRWALEHRVRKGMIEREHYGLYRVASFPRTPRDDLYALQTSAPDATFSHETALELYELSDVLPTTLHVIVPMASGLKPRQGVTIHRSDLAPNERILRDDLWVTSLARTLRDCARRGTDSEQLIAALNAGREQGLLSTDALIELARTYPFTGRIR